MKYEDDSKPLDVGQERQKPKRVEEAHSASLEVVPDSRSSTPRDSESNVGIPMIDARKMRPASPTVKKLRGAIEKQCEAALCFKDMMSSLSEIIPSESTRQAAALAAVHKSRKFTSSQVLSSLESRMKLLDSEAKALAEENEQAKRQVAQYQAERREKEQLIAKLTKQIAAVEAEKKELESKASKKEVACRAAAVDLKEAVETLREEFEQENRVFLSYFKKA